MKKIYMTLATALLFISTYSQSETCAGATELTGDTDSQFIQAAAGDTTGKSTEGGNSSPDVFYFITPGAIQTVNISLCLANNFDSKLTIFSDCTLTTIIAENSQGPAGCGLQAQVSFQSDATSTYIIMVEGADNPLDINTLNPGGVDFGAFEISVWFEAPVATPDAAQGVSCTSSTSGSTIFYFDELDSQGSWDVTSNTGNANGVWEFGNTGSGSHGSSTGPSVVYSGASYISYEASGSSTATASAISPAINLSELNIVEAAELTFYMHAYGVQMGTLNVGVGTSSSGPFTTEMTWSGQYQSASTDPWFKVGVDLTAYIGQIIYIEFEFTGAGGFQGDMAIDLVEVSVCDTALGIEDEEFFDTVTLYPNPANDIINIRSQEIIDEFGIYNLLGQQVKFGTPNAKQTIVDIADLKAGVYIIKVKRGAQFGTYKIVKQ
ncbi:MAG: T9SS type A sorting domain-containing protein [Flavobacteriaceae bacterium]